MKREKEPHSASVFAQVLGDPNLQIDSVRTGVTGEVARLFLEERNFSASEILEHLRISSSTYFRKKPPILTTEISEKILRLAYICRFGDSVLGSNCNSWLFSPNAALGGQTPISLLDSEPGARLVEQTLLQIGAGTYG